ncbi:thyrotropin-releasing hormone-degrading ectoenzyme-like [Nylanderia fulva]|uniref:thyrotropin-releasing hormone-degrading ectoenzyme-like n=1 Tax=Nylanderia fulva TaxID=613905 RepID=UPI0010FB6A20|nr:thyrotropin-releasing hormone-degrading ectoenzyme-like [Nylanderia fulva]
MAFLILLLISRLIFCDASSLHTANNFLVKDSNIKKHHILDDKIPERNVSNITNYYLSNDIIPDHYVISLSLTNMKNYKIISISGMISINFRIIHPTKTIDFHAQKPYIKIRNYIFFQRHNSRNEYVTIDLVEKSYNPLSHIFVLYFAEELSQGHYTLKMEFDCNVDDKMESFFQTTYINNTEKKWMAATRFHKIGARQIFPCWDEPELTATFRIAIKHRSKHIVLSNMPVNKTDIINDKRMWSIFKVTPIISTHLVAFIVFDPTLKYPVQEILSPFRLEFAQKIATVIIDDLYSTWNVSEYLEQMQHIAIPNFPDNAMVNWGLNFYSLSNIIYEERKDPVIRKIEVARLIACKITQQWGGLGNLVSPTSGPSLWLNDGISMLLGIQALDKIFPDWQIMDLLTVQYRYESLHLDCGFLKPLTSKITHISEVNSFFSYPYYAKAFTIMNMLRNILSDFIFEDGIKIYFNTYKYKAASINDFWSTMQIVQNISSNSSNITLNVSRIMNAWTTQSQYPVLKIKQHHNATQFIILLENFDVLHLNEWWIPIVFSTTEELWDPTMFYNYIWLTSNKSMEIIKLRLREKKIIEILLNLSLIGYFRVNYDVPIWNRIIRLLVPKNLENPRKYIALPALIKANLIDDAFHFVIADQLKPEIFWKMSKFLTAEEEYIAWYPMFKIFEYISRILPIKSHKVDKIKENVQILFLVITTMDIDLKEYSKDVDLTKCLKQEIARWACVFDYDTCINGANKELTMHLYSPSTNRILPWWKTWTFCHGMGHDYGTWSNVLHLWLDSFDAKESSRILEFLCCTTNEAAIKLMLRKGDDPNLTEKPTFSSLQVRDHIKVFSLLITKHAQNYKLLDYILSNFEKLKPREISTAAALIIIINHIYSNRSITQIQKFVFYNLNELYLNVHHKIIIRANQIMRLHNDLDHLW